VSGIAFTGMILMSFLLSPFLMSSIIVEHPFVAPGAPLVFAPMVLEYFVLLKSIVCDKRMFYFTFNLILLKLLCAL